MRAIVVHTIVALFVLPVSIGLVIPQAGTAEIIPRVPLGPIDFVQLGARPNNMITGKLTGLHSDDLIVTYERPFLSIFTGGDHFMLEHDYSISLIQRVTTRDGSDVIACVPSTVRRIDVFRFEPARKQLEKIWSTTLDSRVYHLQAADITGDGNQDLLLLLEDRPGITVMRGNGDGTFGRFEVLFDETVVAHFQVVDINGDGIKDFVLYDPIKNVLRVHFGFGRLVYALERQHPLPMLSNYFRAIPIVDDAIYDLVAFFPESKELRVYLGDGLGRYALIQTKRLTSARNVFLFLKLFDGKGPDLLVAERETGIIRAYRNRGERGFEHAGSIKVERNLLDLAAIFDPALQRNVIYCLDTQHERLVVLNILPAVKEYLPNRLAVGSEPTHVVTANLFGGELPELYALCKESATISVYWYNENFELNHSMITVPGSPDRLYVYRTPTGRSKLVVLDETSDLLTIVSVQWDQFDLKMYGIPSILGSEVVHLGSTVGGWFQFGTFVFSPQEKSAFVSFFEQIGSDEYIERTLDPITDGQILALDASDLTGNKVVDIVYIYRSDTSSDIFMTSALNDSTYAFHRQRETLILRGRPITRGFLLSEGNNANGVSYIVYLHGDETGEAYLFRVRRDQAGRFIIRDGKSGRMNIQDRRHITFLRSLGHSVYQILLYDRLSGQVRVVPSASDGLFLPSKTLMTIEDLIALTVYSDPTGTVHQLVAARKNTPYLEVYRIDE